MQTRWLAQRPICRGAARSVAGRRPGESSSNAASCEMIHAQALRDHHRTEPSSNSVKLVADAVPILPGRLAVS